MLHLPLRNRSIALALVLATSGLGVAACEPMQSSSSGGGDPSLDSEEQVASYGIGINMGRQLETAAARIDMDALIAGLRDGMAGREPRVEGSEIQAALENLTTTLRAEEQERLAAQADANAAEGESFLAENAGKEGVTVTESGLQYEVLREGEGARPGPDDRVTIHYKGTLIDGTQFDSSYDRGEPATFSVGGVIPGFSEGLQLMAPGSQYRFYIPSELGYGPRGPGRTSAPTPP